MDNNEYKLYNRWGLIVGKKKKNKRREGALAHFSLILEFYSIEIEPVQVKFEYAHNGYINRRVKNDRKLMSEIYNRIVFRL